MKPSRSLITLFCLSCAFSLVFAQDAYAYLDPGTGSYIIQVVVAVVLGGFYALKVYWHRIKAFFSKSQEGEDGSK